ncbi:hypothetical protein AB0L70_24865 [Kribbella sp. NPDC051952]|uniref:hypothetical protein n=1 Tax=Kribbella sp. NPDC051952 TaxID=3154851 RepID=UPI00342A59F5
MTIIDAAPETSVGPSRRLRTWAVILLPIGPLLTVVEAAIPHDSATGAGRGWSILAGLVSTPFLFATVAIAAAVSWLSSRRMAGIAFVALTLQLFGLAALHGIEAFQLAATNDGISQADLDHAMDGILSIPPGPVFLAMFMGGLVVGSFALSWAQFRTRSITPAVPVLMVITSVSDLVIPDGAPDVVKTCGLGLFTVWSVVLAVSVHRGGGFAKGLPTA